jgi:hypothetical protein
VDICEFAEYQNQIMYNYPTTTDASNAAWTCIYSSGGRKAGQQTDQNCNSNTGGTWMSGRGLSGQDGPQASFTPRFPGTYVLNYTTVDGCNQPVTQMLTVVAKCVTKVTPPQLPAVSYSDFYCAGNPNYNQQSQTTGQFTPIDLWALASHYPNNVMMSNFSTPTPALNLTARCWVAPTTYTCTGLQNTFNTWDFGMNMDSGVSNKFKQCCQCLYSLQIINGGSSSPSTPSGSPGSPGSSPSSPGSPSGSPGQTNSGSGKGGSQKSALAEEEARRKRNENVLIGLAAPLGVILVASMALNAYMLLKIRSGPSPSGGFNVEAGDVELSTSPSRHMDV